jgi:hypothetical protein
VFSTGAFFEPIEIWDEFHCLAFRVTDQPPPIGELSPFHIDKRHAHEGVCAINAIEVPMTATAATIMTIELGNPRSVPGVDRVAWPARRCEPSGVLSRANPAQLLTLSEIASAPVSL